MQKTICFSIYRNPIDKYFWSRIYSWDASQVEIRGAQNSISRISSLGHGTQERLAQSEGELYRDVCMRILNLHGGEGGYEFKFHETD